MFDDRLEKLRLSSGMTQQEIADKLNIPRITYRTYEKNKHEPTADILKQLAVIFGVSCDYLLGFEENAEPPDIETEIINSILPDLTTDEKKTVRQFCEFLKSQH